MATAVALIAVISLSSCGNSGPDARKSRSPQTAGPVAEVRSLLEGIPQRGNTLGKPTARVTLQYFGDLECPFCREFTLGVLASIIRRWVRPGTLKIEYRSLKTATHGLEIFKAQQFAALAAGRQNRMWDFIELFYHEQGEENSGYVTEDFLQSLAEQVPGLNLIAWTAARGDTALAGTLVGDARAAYEEGFHGTPSFLIGNTGDRLLRFKAPTITEAAPYDAAVEEVLKGCCRSRPIAKAASASQWTYAAQT